jgi:hypothetical protein
MNIPAVDPGLEGAAAVLNARGPSRPSICRRSAKGRVGASTRPILPTCSRRTGRTLSSQSSRQLVAEAGRQHVPCFRASYGIFGVIGALAIPLRHASPAQWKRAMRLNDDAETLRARAVET